MVLKNCQENTLQFIIDKIYSSIITSRKASDYKRVHFLRDTLIRTISLDLFIILPILASELFDQIWFLRKCKLVIIHLERKKNDTFGTSRA